MASRRAKKLVHLALNCIQNHLLQLLKSMVFICIYMQMTQLYLPFDPQNSEIAMLRMEACITEIKSWMANNFLKLNDDKTEFIMFGTQRALQSVSEWTVSVGDVEVVPSRTVRNIGAMMDSALTMKPHIDSIIKSCYIQMRSLSKIRKYLTEEAAKSLTHAFVSSRLDMMNAILFKIPDDLLKKLQLIQNHAARIVKKANRYCHATPLLKDLHWLPIKSRIQFKILLLVFKSIHMQ